MSVHEHLQNVRDIWRASREDIGETNIVQRLAMTATTAAFLADIPLHEAALGMTAGWTYSETHNPLIAGAAMGATSFVIESGISSGTAITVNGLPKAVDTYQEKYLEGKTKGKASYDDDEVGSFKDDAVFALAFGSGPLVVKKHMAREQESEERSVGQDVRVGVRAAGFLGVFNTALAGGVTAVAWGGEKLDVSEVSDVIIDVARSPFTYIGLFGLRYGVKRIKRWKNARHSGQEGALRRETDLGEEAADLIVSNNNAHAIGAGKE